MTRRGEERGTAASQPPDARRDRVSRRKLLLASGTGVIGVAAGAGGAMAAEQLVPSAPEATAVIPPSEQLMREHGVLERVLLIYRETQRRLEAGDQMPADALRQAARIIQDYIQSFHEGLEEAYVFPRLRRAGKHVETVDTLLVQHAKGRRINQQILSDASRQGLQDPNARERLTTAVEQFVRMYEVHEAREDTVIFPAFRDLLPDAEFRRLGERFADQEDKYFGPRGFADMVQRVADIENALGIHDLAQFTPTV
jgi:hemerythrin-like domain-containing protein